MARNTIRTRISLDGGREIRDDLKELGEAGEQAFRKIQASAAKADLARFADSVGRLGRDLATVGKRMSLAFAGIATAAAAAGASMGKLAKDAADVVDAQADAAEGAGLAIDAYGRLQHAAKLSGDAHEVLDASLARFNIALGDAAAGNKTAADAFARLGVSLRGADGRVRSMEDVFLDVAEALSLMPEGAERAPLPPTSLAGPSPN